MRLAFITAAMVAFSAASPSLLWLSARSQPVRADDPLVYRVQISDLDAKFTSNEAAALKWVTGKQILVRGTIRIGELFPGGQGVDITEDSHGDEDAGTASFIFFPQVEHMLAGFRNGQTVFCCGRFWRRMYGLQFLADWIAQAGNPHDPRPS